MPFSYANPASGPSAGGIGWFNFGTLSMVPGDSVTGLTGTLSNGNIVTFYMALSLVSGAPRRFSASPVPTYPFAQFGAAGYTGLTGNVAMYAVSSPASTGSYRFTISNITVQTPGGDPVPNFSVLLADAESTNLFESFGGQTNGGTWRLFTAVGTGSSPIVTGLSTQTFNSVGVQQFGPVVANLYQTQAATQVSVTLALQDPADTRQAFALGFATTRIRFEKNIAQRINAADQFVLAIEGSPSSQVFTTGSSSGIQPQVADVFAVPNQVYNINEVMAPGSISLLTDYNRTLSTSNATPGGSVPPSGPLPVNFAPALGDDVTFTILNAAPQTYEKTVDKAYADLGDLLTYTVTVNNLETFAINNVLVTDLTPPGTTYVGNLTVSAPYTGTDPASGITIATIPASSSVTLSWQVKVNSLPPISNPITNYATISVPGGNTGITNVVTTQVNTAFIAVIKMVDQPFAKLGDVLTYMLTLNNVGNTAANNVVLTDAIPAGTTFVPGSVTGATGTPPLLSLSNPIPAGGSATVTFQVQIGNAVPNPNPVPNAARATYTYTVDPANPNGGSRSAQSNTVTTLVNVAMLTTTKAVDKVFAAVGDLLTYTLILTNTGSIAADNVVITDAVPAGATFVPGSVTGATGTPPTLTLANAIAPGGTATVTFQVQVGNTVPTPNPISNRYTTAFTYTVDPQNPDSESGTSSSNIVNTQINSPVLTSLKTADKAYVKPGDVLTYTLQLTNNGNTAANNIVLTDVLPAGVTFIGGSLFGATGTPPTLTLSNALPVGGSATVLFQVLVGSAIPTPNPLLNTFTAAFTYTLDPEDPDGATGTSSSNIVSTQVNGAVVTTTKSVDKAFATVGDVLTYTVMLQNSGNVAANQVVLTDAVPSGTTFVPGSLTGATGTPPTLNLLSSIPAGGSVVVSYQVKVGASVPSTNPVPNTASAAFTYTVDPARPNGASGTAPSNTVNTLVSIAKLGIVKAVDQSIAYLGDLITYQLAVQNTGNVDADNVVLTDLLPTGVSYVAGSLVVSVPYSGTLVSGLALSGPVAPGQVVTLSFRAKVDAIPNPNPIRNKAAASYTYTVDPASPDGQPGQTTSNIVTTVVLRYNYSRQVTDIIHSVAQEQAALAAIANAEGAKIQAAAAMGDITQQELLCINKSVADMLESISLLESVLKQKLSIVDCQIDGTNAGCM